MFNGIGSISFHGGFSLTSTVNQPFHLQVVGLGDSGEEGAVAGFVADESRTWRIVTTDSPLGDIESRLAIDTSGFLNYDTTAEDSRWYVSERSGGLYLTYLVPSQIDSIQGKDARLDLVHNMMQTWVGDANLDGEFNTSDLVAVFLVNEYEDLVEDNSAWVDGDWDGDGDFTSSDLVFAFTDSGFERGQRAVVRAVPESLGPLPLLYALLLAVPITERYTRRRGSAPDRSVVRSPHRPVARRSHSAAVFCQMTKTRC